MVQGADTQQAWADQLAPQVDPSKYDEHSLVAQSLMLSFNHPDIIEKYGGSAIQLTQVSGAVAKKVVKALNGNPDDIKVLAMGDMDPPPLAIETLKDVTELEYSIKLELLKLYGPGYDMGAQGSEWARSTVINKAIAHLGIPGKYRNTLVNQTIIGSSGMAWMRIILRALTKKTLEENPGTSETKLCDLVKQKVIVSGFPFVMADEVFQGTTSERERDLIHLPVSAKNLLHQSPEDVHRYYKEYNFPEQKRDLWYLIPAGNPNGVIIDPKNFEETCKKIVELNPDAVIALDLAYVRIMEPSVAKKVFHGVVNNPTVMNRCVFFDSASKPGARPCDRDGWTFTTNPELFNEILAFDQPVEQGHGAYTDAMAIAENTLPFYLRQERRQLYQFWAREKLGLYFYLKEHPQFSELFEAEQEHLAFDGHEIGQLLTPSTLYLTLKLKEGKTFVDVAIATTILGLKGVSNKELFINGKAVDENQNLIPEEDITEGDNYIRFAVSMLNKPTFSKYIPDKYKNLSALGYTTEGEDLLAGTFDA